jgi:heme/copper-type cytochrome/quinol oxidase subunit 2
MIWLLALVFGAPIIGLVIAIFWWLMRDRRAGLPAGTVALFVGLAGSLGVLAEVLHRVMGSWSLLIPFALPADVIIWYWDYRFLVPLLAGILSLVLLAFPVRARRGLGSADLSPRSPLMFARGWWFIPPIAVLAVVLVITFAAGTVSEPDPESGRYVSMVLDGGVGSVGVTIYGWFYSVPSMIAMAVLVVVAGVDLFLIARPPLGDSREDDVRIRTVRTQSVLAVTTGALLIHLGVVFGSLSGTASVRGSFSTSEGTMFLWSPIAALESVFYWSAYVACTCGIVLWARVALSGIPVRRVESAEVAV